MQTSATEKITTESKAQRLSDSYAPASAALTQAHTCRGTFLLGAVWTVHLLSDGKMGASKGRAALIRLALGRA